MMLEGSLERRKRAVERAVALFSLSFDLVTLKERSVMVLLLYIQLKMGDSGFASPGEEGGRKEGADKCRVCK